MHPTLVCAKNLPKPTLGLLEAVQQTFRATASLRQKPNMPSTAPRPSLFVHPAPPPTERDAEELLSSVQQSFRKHLDASSHDPAALVVPAPGAANPVDPHLARILTARVFTPPTAATKQLRVRQFLADPVGVFEDAAALGTATHRLALLCARRLHGQAAAGARRLVAAMVRARLLADAAAVWPWLRAQAQAAPPEMDLARALSDELGWPAVLDAVCAGAPTPRDTAARVVACFGRLHCAVAAWPAVLPALERRWGLERALLVSEALVRAAPTRAWRLGHEEARAALAACVAELAGRAGPDMAPWAPLVPLWARVRLTTGRQEMAVLLLGGGREALEDLLRALRRRGAARAVDDEGAWGHKAQRAVLDIAAVLEDNRRFKLAGEVRAAARVRWPSDQDGDATGVWANGHVVLLPA